MFAGASVKIHVPHRRGLRLLVPGGATDATGTADSGYRVQSLRRWGRTAYTYGDGSIPINTIFRGMNIHLPAILMFTRGTRF